jgi:hypothetical protein
VVVVIKGKEKGKWKRKGKVGSYTLEVEGKEKKDSIREVVIEGRNRGNNRRRKEGRCLLTVRLGLVEAAPSTSGTAPQPAISNSPGARTPALRIRSRRL